MHKLRMLTPIAFLLAIASIAIAEPRLYVLNKSDATVSVVDPLNDLEEAVIKVGDGPHEAATSPDARTIVVANYGTETHGNTISVIDVLSRTVTKTIDLAEYQRPHGILFLTNDTICVTAERQKKLCIIDIREGIVKAAIDTDQEASHMVAVTPDSGLAFVANIRSGSVSVIDLQKQKLTKVIPTAPGAEGVFAHPTRGEVWITNRSANTVTIIDTKSLAITDELDAPAFPIRIAITPDGEHALVSCARSGDVVVFDVATRKELRRIPMNEQAVAEPEKDKRLFGDQFEDSPVPVGILIDPDGSRAYVANTNADIISVIDLNTWKIVKRLHAGNEPDGLAWSPRG